METRFSFASSRRTNPFVLQRNEIHVWRKQPHGRPVQIWPLAHRRDQANRRIKWQRDLRFARVIRVWIVAWKRKSSANEIANERANRILIFVLQVRSKHFVVLWETIRFVLVARNRREYHQRVQTTRSRSSISVAIRMSPCHRTIRIDHIETSGHSLGLVASGQLLLSFARLSEIGGDLSRTAHEVSVSYWWTGILQYRSLAFERWYCFSYVSSRINWNRSKTFSGKLARTFISCEQKKKERMTTKNEFAQLFSLTIGSKLEIAIVSIV